MLHHLTHKIKQKTLNETFRVLKSGGQFLIADWGRPANKLMRLCVYIVQLVDGFETTHDNIKGALPEMISQSGFRSLSIFKPLNTPIGTLTMIKTLKP